MKEKKKLTYKEEQIKLKRIKRVKWVLAITGWTLLGVAFFGLIGLQVKSCVGKKNKGLETTITTPVRNIKRDSASDLHYVLNVNSVPFTWNDLELLEVTNGTIQNGLFDVTNNRSVHLGFQVGTSTSPINPLEYGYTVNFTTAISHTSINYFTYWVGENGSVHTIKAPSTFEYTTQLALYSSVEEIDDNDGEITPYNAWGLLLGQNGTPLNNDYIDVEMSPDIDRFAIFNLNNALTVLIGSDKSGTYTIFNGVFKDASGTIYTKVKIEYMNIDGQYYINNVGQLKEADRTDVHYTAFKALYYTDINGNDILVDACRYTTVGGTVALAASTQWENYSYRFLKIYKSYVVYNGTPYTGQDGIRNLELLNDSTIDVGGNGYGLYDAFDLISMAFRSLIDLLSITIIPGVTLGTLVFIPVVGIIVVFIVWLFKR